ncbi:DNA repair protein RecO [Neisseria animalis]|uniref:DNA repair protein RecO n=1 Tax=Neisseria animalis TaxID=492 RepID=A0A5P3MPH9_NEIAN|nr:DNA repair protein RecO [Neisseria animalis]QEY23452.1 DNA repair protein RecO [Neisseria animalis]ROW33297.1 DNA repair protein RecO [Neisseria animalis]VEE08971.1 DNA repair protein (recombination protein o) [Neisseria animalis]
MSDHRINHEPAFLLASTPWRESSLWLEMYSRRYGRVALLARSARKRMSELRGILVPFVPISASWYGTQELKTLHRAEWLGGWQQPQGRALFSGLYINEIMLKMTAREDPQPELFDKLSATLQTVCTENNHIAALRRFEWTMLTLLGHAPDLHHDQDGLPVRADKQYWLMPQDALRPYSPNDTPPPQGITVGGDVLIQLRDGEFADGFALQQSLKITRLLLDFHLPDGITSRQVLQQLQQFQTA